MILFSYEVKKLFGMRFFRITLLVMLTVNCVLSFYAASNGEKGNIPYRELSTFFSTYFENKEEMDTYYRELVNSSVQDPMQSPNIQQDEHRYAPDGYTDLQMFAALYESINWARQYPECIDAVVEAAENNLIEFRAMGIDQDSYNYRLQEHIIRTYSDLKKTVIIGIEPSYGWAVYFNYSSQSAILFVLYLLVSISVASCDHVTGTLPISYCTKHGRKGIVGAKIMTVLITSLFLTLLFSLSSFLSIGLRCGYSSTTNAIQSLEGFEYCQYALTIGQYFVLSLLLRFLAFSMLSVIVMIIATWIRNRALAFCVGLLILGSQYVLSNVTYVNPDSPLKNLNVITFTDVSPLFIRLRACNFAGMVCPYAPLAFIVCTGLAVLMFVLFGVVFVNQQPGVAKHHRNTDTLPSLIANRKKTWQMVRISPSGLFIAEFFKILIASGMLSVLLLSVAGKYVVVQYKYQDWNSVSDRVYYEYMSELQGPMTDQKLLRIQMEREKIDSIIANYQWKQQEFVEGSITSSEYAKYLQEFEYAQSKDGYLAVIEEKRDRLLSEISKGREGWFIYDTGWLKLVHSGIDILLMLTISLLACQAFSMEYRSKYSCDSFNTILRATPYGRSKTFFAKFIVVLIIATMVFIVFSVIEVMTIVSRYVLPAADAPLSSLVGYEALPTSLTVGSYNIILLVAKWILCLLLALDLFSLSCLLRQGMYALVIGVAVAALVGILNHLFGTYVIVYIAILLLPLTTILIIASYRKFIA